MPPTDQSQPSQTLAAPTQDLAFADSWYNLAKNVVSLNKQIRLERKAARHSVQLVASLAEKEFSQIVEKVQEILQAGIYAVAKSDDAAKRTMEIMQSNLSLIESTEQEISSLQARYDESSDQLRKQVRELLNKIDSLQAQIQSNTSKEPKNAEESRLNSIDDLLAAFSTKFSHARKVILR